MNDSLLLFSTLSLVTVAVPGPTTLLALNNGARRGLGAALPGVTGAVLSDAVLIAAVAAGLGGLLATSALAFELLRWIGVAYLAWLGWRLLCAPHAHPAADTLSAPLPHEASGTALRRSFTVAITNPKGYLFFSAMLPSFIDTESPLLPQYLLLATVFAALDAVVLLACATAGWAGARKLRGPHTLRRLDRASGLALLALAASLALWRREA